MFTKNKYTIYFYLILFFIVSLLLITANYSLSISYKEALNLYYNSSILSIITNSFTYIFGHNDLALRVPFIIFYTLSVILMFLITKDYFKYEKDRFISVLIFMSLPGVLSASLLVNTAIIVTSKSMDDGEIMSLEIKGKNIYGVQFHPESIMSEYGHKIIDNFLKI